MLRVAFFAILVLLPITSAYAGIAIDPEYTSSYTGSGCASEIDEYTCTTNEDYTMDASCLSACKSLSAQPTTTKTITNNMVQVTYHYPQLFVFNDCNVGRDRYPITCRAATEAESIAGSQRYGIDNAKTDFNFYCIAGYYGQPASIDDSAACSKCPTGTTSVSGQNTTSFGCVTSTVTSCDYGEYLKDDTCYKCTNYTYSNGGRVTSCSTVPDGNYATDCSDQTLGIGCGAYEECLPGHWCSGGKKTACPTGTFNPDYGTRWDADCYQCPNVSSDEDDGYSDIGTESKTQCYAQKEVKYHDDAGTFTFRQDCYYTN